MAFDYAVLGAGRQGTAAAYDLARNGDAGQLLIADVDLARAQRAAGRVNDLLGEDAASAAALDVRDGSAVERFLRGVTACVSAAPVERVIAGKRVLDECRTRGRRVEQTVREI